MTKSQIADPVASASRLLRRIPDGSEHRYIGDLVAPGGAGDGLFAEVPYGEGEGIVLDEPSVVSIRHEGGPHGKKIIQDAAVAATLNGNPTDIMQQDGLVAVIDGSGTLSHLSIFKVDGDGNLALKGVSTIGSAANGVAIVPAATEEIVPPFTGNFGGSVVA